MVGHMRSRQRALIVSAAGGVDRRRVDGAAVCQRRGRELSERLSERQRDEDKQSGEES